MNSKTCALALLVVAAIASGCEDDGAEDGYMQDTSVAENVGHDMIELGEQLDDPYSLENMTKALANVAPTKASRTDISATDVYVRFLPSGEDQLETLESLGLDLMDHPLDYKIVKDGDYYHDPLIPEEEITWQYAVVPMGFEYPQGIRCEVLDECYIPDDETKSNGIDWDEVEREAYRLTGNEGLLCLETKASAGPSGRITIVDEESSGGKPFGVAGVKVVCNSFVKFATTYTDRDGYYQVSKKFRSKVRYRLRFKNKKGFAIGFDKVVVSASSSALGRGTNAGIDYTVTKDSNRKLWCRCVVNNASYDYYNRCSAEDLGIKTPPKNLRFWIFQHVKPSLSPMMKQGTVVESDFVSEYLGDYAWVIKKFLPDIVLGLKGQDAYSSIYGETVHQLSHASHFSNVGTEYWDSYVKYLGLSLLSSPRADYGNGTDEDAGYCEVAEMWAYFMQNSLHQDRYGGTFPSEGTSWWFRPQILSYIHDNGVGRSRIFAALGENVVSKDDFQMALEEECPEKSEMIEIAFAKY